MALFSLTSRDKLASDDKSIRTSSLIDEFDNFLSQLSAWLVKNHNEDGTHNTRTTSGVDFVPAGGMIFWPMPSAPTGWILCDGRAISRTDYPKLFKVIGVTYGTGDGSSTFSIPTKTGYIILAA